MDRFAALKADINRELQSIERLTRELDEILVVSPKGSVARVRAAGRVLHDFYTGVENISPGCGPNRSRSTSGRRLAHSAAPTDGSASGRDSSPSD